MNLAKIILNFCLSVLFIASPVLGFSAEINHESFYASNCCEDSCEMMVEKELCHHTETPESKDDCQDKCKDSCTDHASHVVPQTIQAPIHFTTKPISFNYKELKRNTFYQDLNLQQIIFQFWHPPKHV